MGFQMESDAERIMEVLPKRFNRFKLRPSSGKDPIDPIWKTTTGREAERNLRFSRVYLLLGQKPQGQLGYKEANSAETAKPFYADVVELVQRKSARPLERAA